MGLGNRIDSIAKEKRLSLRKVSERAKIPYNTLYAIVKRDGATNLENVPKIAQALGVSVWDLLGHPKTIGDRIASARSEAGVTKEELSKKLSVPLEHVNQWEINKKNPTLEMLHKIALVLNVELNYFTGYSEDITAYMLAAYPSDEVRTNDNGQIELIYDPEFDRVKKNYDLLNKEGRKAAADRVEELTMIPKYHLDSLQHTPESDQEE